MDNLNYDPTDPDKMRLPVGKTCGECGHFTRTCVWLISCKPTNTTCDWSPSRFREKPNAS